jgi:hypothetical protein
MRTANHKVGSCLLAEHDRVSVVQEHASANMRAGESVEQRRRNEWKWEGKMERDIRSGANR